MPIQAVLKPWCIANTAGGLRLRWAVKTSVRRPKSQMTKYILERGEKISNWERCSCGNFAEMHLICEGVHDTRTHHPEAFDWERSYYKVLLCPACEQILILRYVTTGNEINDEKTRQFPYVEYTRQVLYSPTKPRHYSIPAPIADVLTQAEKVAPTSPRAALILCRAALEEICRAQGIPESKVNSKGTIEYLHLKKRVNLLLERERLSDDLREIMHGIRDIGNESTHGAQSSLSQKVSQDEVEVLIGLVDYILNRLYVDKARSDEAIRDLDILRKKILNTTTRSTKDENSPFPDL